MNKIDNWFYKIAIVALTIVGVLSLFGFTPSNFTIAMMCFYIAFDSFIDIKNKN